MAVCTTPRLALVSRQDIARSTASQFLEGKGTLSLKVLGPGKPGRVVSIRSPKCTIGSGTGCTLRLRAAGIDSLHCWVLRGAAGTVIRRMNGAATLNGSHFDEAMLSVGDRLSIGPVQLEVVDCNTTPFQSQIPVEVTAQFQNEIQSLQSKLDDSQSQIKRLEVESRQGFESSIMAAERADQLRDALAAANQQLEEICNELNAAQDSILAQKTELTAQTAKLATVQSGAQRSSDAVSRLEAEVAAAIAQRDELEFALCAAQEQLQTDVAATSAQRDELQNALNAAQEQLQAEIAAASARRDELELALCAAQEQLQTEIAAANAQRDELQNALNAQEQLQTEIAAAIARRDELELALCAAQEQLQTEIAAANAQRDEQQNALTATQEQLQTEIATVTAEREELQIALNAAQEQAAKDREAQQQACEQLEQRCQQLDAELQSSRNESPINSAAVTAVFEQRAFLDSTNGNQEELERQIAEKDFEIAELRRQLDCQTNLEQRCEQLTGECDGKGQELSQAHSQVEQLSTRLQDMQQLVQKYEQAVHQQSDLAERESKLAETTQALENERAALAAETAQLQQARDEFEQQKAQIDEANRQLAAEQANLRELVERAAADQNNFDQNNAEQNNTEFQAREAELVTRVAEVDRLFEQLVEQRAALVLRSDDIERLQSDCLKRAQELECQALELRTLQEQFRCESSSADEQPAYCAESAEIQNENGTTDNSENDQPAPHDTGVDSVLSRLVQAGIWRQDEPGETPTAAAELTTNEPAEPTYSPTVMFESVAPSIESAPRCPQPASTSDGDDESIESYMDRLMKRVRGDSPIGQSTWKPAAPPVERTPAQPAPAPINVPVENTADAVEQPLTEYTPRRAAPELTSSLNAMRDLANSAARTAIDQHVRLHTSRLASRRMLCACLTVVGSAVLAIWAWRVHSLHAAAGAFAGGAIGVYWTFAALRRMSGLKRLERETEPVAEPTTPVELLAPVELLNPAELPAAAELPAPEVTNS